MKKQKLKITLIGPAYPYRGGIAQYNNQLYNALKNYSVTDVISFKRMYPKWLYPGKTDKDTSSNTSIDKNIKFVIDVYSPLSLRTTVDTIITNKTDVVLLTWWTLFWQPGMAYIARRLRKKGVKVVYICHNVFDHDSSKIIQRASKLFLGQSDGYIVHSTEQRELLSSLYDKAILNTKLLPIYNQYPKAKGNLKKRGRLELLFFGFIRPYKGLDDFVNALSQLNDKSIYTSIVGEVWKDEAALRNDIESKNIPNLELCFKYVSDEEAAEYFNRADVVVLPYKSATGSAVASVAYNYRKPILGTSVGGLSDAVVEGKTGWLVEPNSPLRLAKAIKSKKRSQAITMSKDIEEFCRDHNWDNFADNVCELAASL